MIYSIYILYSMIYGLISMVGPYLLSSVLDIGFLFKNSFSVVVSSRVGDVEVGIGLLLSFVENILRFVMFSGSV